MVGSSYLYKTHSERVLLQKWNIQGPQIARPQMSPKHCACRKTVIFSFFPSFFFPFPILQFPFLPLLLTIFSSDLTFLLFPFVMLFPLRFLLGIFFEFSFLFFACLFCSSSFLFFSFLFLLFPSSVTLPFLPGFFAVLCFRHPAHRKSPN